MTTRRDHYLAIAAIQVLGDRVSTDPVKPPKPITPPIVDPVKPHSVVGIKVELDKDSAEHSSGAGNPASNVFKKGKYSRTDKKAIGEWWSVNFKG